jgi:hypothetical protein
MLQLSTTFKLQQPATTRLKPGLLQSTSSQLTAESLVDQYQASTVQARTGVKLPKWVLITGAVISTLIPSTVKAAERSAMPTEVVANLERTVEQKLPTVNFSNDFFKNAVQNITTNEANKTPVQITPSMVNSQSVNIPSSFFYKPAEVAPARVILQNDVLPVSSQNTDRVVENTLPIRSLPTKFSCEVIAPEQVGLDPATSNKKLVGLFGYNRFEGTTVERENLGGASYMIALTEKGTNYCKTLANRLTRAQKRGASVAVLTTVAGTAMGVPLLASNSISSTSRVLPLSQSAGTKVENTITVPLDSVAYQTTSTL